MWAAEDFVGKVRKLRKVRAHVPLEAREMGLTARDLYAEPLAYCAICGTGLLHYYEVLLASGEKVPVGEECIRIALGGDLPGVFMRIQAKSAAEEAWAKAKALEAKELAKVWRAQAKLRGILLAGARQERLLGYGNWWQRALDAAREGRMSERWEEYILRHAKTPAEAKEVAKRTAIAMDQIFWLAQCRLGKFDGPIVYDFQARLWPSDPWEATGSPLTERQAELVDKKHKRYRKQIKPLRDAFFRREMP